MDLCLIHALGGGRASKRSMGLIVCVLGLLDLPNGTVPVRYGSLPIIGLVAGLSEFVTHIVGGWVRVKLVSLSALSPPHFLDWLC